jgi:hypothetical protein
VAITIDPTLGVGLEDRDVWARQIVESRRKRRKPAPKQVDLETAITNISIEDTIRGSSTITLTLADPEWVLITSGFLDADKDGKLDPIDVNYPDGSRYWWQLTQLEFGLDGRSPTPTGLIFMERAAAHMMELRGPMKAGRSKTTRAEFLRMASRRVKKGGGIIFHSKELHDTQPVAGGVLKEEKGRKENKDSGINDNAKVRFTNFDGKEYTLKPGELRNAEIALDEAFHHTQDTRAILALNCACIVEAPFFRNPRGGDSSSVGILQLLDTHLGGSVEERRNIPRVVDMFLNRGFSGRGGAIALARQHPNWTVGQIAQAVQGSRFPDRYDKVRGGAEKVLDAYGGSSGVSTTYRKEHHFTIGTPEKPREDLWEGSNRLADEVEWPFFLDGQHLYFDPETVLIKQKPAAVISRNDSFMIGFRCGWDTRHIATEVELTLICEPFEFRAGEVLQLDGFGPASNGSTVKLPGRWLIEEMRRERFELTSTFKLKQPERPEPEPAPEIGTRSFNQEDVAEGVSDLYDACSRIDRQNRPYVWGGGHGAQLTSLVSNPIGLDCSSSCSLALKMAGMFNGSVALVSSGFETSWGEAGRGEEFTVWANRGHVFIQSEGGGKKWRFDTGGGPPSGPHIRDGHRSTAGFVPRHWPGR